MAEPAKQTPEWVLALRRRMAGLGIPMTDETVATLSRKRPCPLIHCEREDESESSEDDLPVRL